MMIDTTIRKNICIGMLVDIVAENDEQSQALIRGYVKKILSQSNHSKGIKVELTNGKIGRVKHIPTKDEVRLENFKFYNRFFYLPKIYSIWDPQNQHYLVIDHLNKSSNTIEKTAFLFDSYEKAQEFIKETKYENCPIREINRKKTIADNLKKTGAKFVRINTDRKLSLEKLEMWEQYFKNMR